MKSKALELLIAMVEEDKIEVIDILKALGYEVIVHKNTDVSCATDATLTIGFDEVITVKKEFR